MDEGRPMSERNIRTVGELRALIATQPDEAFIEWSYDGPENCCGVHHHDITEVWGCHAEGHASGSGVVLQLSGGSA